MIDFVKKFGRFKIIPFAILCIIAFPVHIGYGMYRGCLDWYEDCYHYGWKEINHND